MDDILAYWPGVLIRQSLVKDLCSGQIKLIPLRGRGPFSFNDYREKSGEINGDLLSEDPDLNGFCRFCMIAGL